MTRKVKSRFWVFEICLAKRDPAPREKLRESRRMVIQIITQMKIAPGAYLALNFKLLEIKDKIGAAIVRRVKLNAEMIIILLFFFMTQLLVKSD